MNDESSTTVEQDHGGPSHSGTPLSAHDEDDWLSDICIPERDVNCETLKQVILLAIELAREGREGRKVGTIFVVSDEANTLKRSKCLILDPLWHHPAAKKQIQDPDLRETLKELAQLDGAFIIADDGTALSACRYINATSKNVDLPLGLGGRHMAAASITRETKAIAVVVSESAIVRVFDEGEIISEIIPELWLLRRHGTHLSGAYATRQFEEMTIVSKRD